MALINIKDIDPSILSASEFRQYKVCCAALYYYYNRDQMGYTFGGTSPFKPPPYVPPSLDCTKFIHYCFQVAGSPDPSGTGHFNGNTESLWRSGVLVGGSGVKAGMLHPGDIVFYGYGSTMVGGKNEHASLYIGDGKIVSHGQDSGPLFYDYTKGDKPVVGARRYQF